MTAQEVMAFLEEHANPGGKKVLMKHGARDPFWGVRIGDMKPLVKKIGKDYELARQLYATGNSDAMYFAGLIADETKMTKKDLRDWIKGAYWYMLSEYTVAGVAAETPYGVELAREWMKSDDEMTICAGWATYCSVVAIRPNEELDYEEISGLLDEVETTIHESQNRVRYDMNQFVICVGCYIPELSERAREVAEAVGKVAVDMGGTACKVPFAPDYIKKVIDRGSLGKKRKVARC